MSLQIPNIISLALIFPSQIEPYNALWDFAWKEFSRLYISTSTGEK